MKGPQSIHTWASSLSLALSVQGSLAHSKLSIQSPPCQLGPGVLIPNAPRSSPLLRVGGHCGGALPRICPQVLNVVWE